MLLAGNRCAQCGRGASRTRSAFGGRRMPVLVVSVGFPRPPSRLPGAVGAGLGTMCLGRCRAGVRPRPSRAGAPRHTPARVGAADGRRVHMGTCGNPGPPPHPAPAVMRPPKRRGCGGVRPEATSGEPGAERCGRAPRALRGSLRPKGGGSPPARHRPPTHVARRSPTAPGNREGGWANRPPQARWVGEPPAAGADDPHTKTRTRQPTATGHIPPHRGARVRGSRTGPP